MKPHMHITSRRDILIGGAALAISTGATAQIRFINPFGRPQGAAPVTNSPPLGDSQYGSMLQNGYAPKFPTWLGHVWSADMGATWNPNMDYCWRTTPGKCRFELRNTACDRAQGDPSTKRRAEIHENKNRFQNGVTYWHAFTFMDQPWSQRMLQPGTIMQMHWPSGASPAFAFRRIANGSFRITTRGDGQENINRYTAALAFGVPHDIVYRFKLDGVSGELDVWLDGNQVLALRGVPIGSLIENGCYLGIGPYFGGGITCPIVHEYANIAPFPSTMSLSARASSPPSWPIA